jgi:hypothetical protein
MTSIAMIAAVIELMTAKMMFVAVLLLLLQMLSF